MESVIGALYLDQGYYAAKDFIEEHVMTRTRYSDSRLYTDPKSRFQELAQEKTGITPHYRVLKESGPDHDRRFIAGVFLEEELIAEGEGSPSRTPSAKPPSRVIKQGW